jgi:DNA modification methylase
MGELKMKIGRFETNKIYNEDCYKAIKELPDKSIDLIITDPPYELETERGGGFFRITNEKRRKYQNEIGNMMCGISKEMLDLMCRKMKKVNMYIFCSRKQMLSLLNYAEDNGLSWNLLTWHKTNPIPTCNNKYLSDTEYIVFMREKSVKVFGDYYTKKTYFVSSVNKDDKKIYNHPTIKPLEIIKCFITNSSNENDLVFDPFIGSGTTAVACKELGRSYMGFEIEDKYFKIAQKRIEDLTKDGQTTIFNDFEQIELDL